MKAKVETTTSVDTCAHVGAANHRRMRKIKTGKINTLIHAFAYAFLVVKKVQITHRRNDYKKEEIPCI